MDKNARRLAYVKLRIYVAEAIRIVHQFAVMCSLCWEYIRADTASALLVLLCIYIYIY